jgi:hypothetical protein
MSDLSPFPCPVCFHLMREVHCGERKSKVHICWMCDNCNKTIYPQEKPKRNPIKIRELSE